MNPVHLLRMMKWVRKPPGRRKVILVLGVVAVCLVLFAIERWIGVPDWLQIEPIRGHGAQRLLR